MKTIPIAEMEKTAGVEPLEGRRQAKLLIHAEKNEEVARLPPAPNAQRPHKKQNKTKQNKKPTRLKRKSLNHLVKEHQKEHADILIIDAHLCEKLNPNSWPPETLHAGIRTTIPGITSKDNQRGLWLWKRLTSTIQQHPEHTSTPMAQLKTPQETEDVVLTSSAQANLHYLCQHLVGYCAQTTELKS